MHVLFIKCVIYVSNNTGSSLKIGTGIKMVVAKAV